MLGQRFPSERFPSALNNQGRRNPTSPRHVHANDHTRAQQRTTKGFRKGLDCIWNLPRCASYREAVVGWSTTQEN